MTTTQQIEATQVTTYQIEYRSDDGYGEAGEPIEAATYRDAEAAARKACLEWLSGGDYGEITCTLRVHGRAVLTWTDEDGDECKESVSVVAEIDPEEPACADGHDDHDWQSPNALFGGLRENPGVRGHGGGVISKSVCAHCGVYRTYDTWAQDGYDGSQGHGSTEYAEADDESRAWVESLQQDESANA